MTVRHKTLRFGLPEAVVCGALALAGAVLFGPRPGIRREIRREEAALAAVRRVAKAEHDLQGERAAAPASPAPPPYVGLKALAAAGRLAGAVSSDAEGDYVDVEGYRVEVLLPAPIDVHNHVPLLRSGGVPDPALSARVFAVTALPRPGVPSGLRGFYLDQDGRLFEAEGVCDADGDPLQPPPGRALEREDEDLGSDRPVWRQRAGPPPPRRN